MYIHTIGSYERESRIAKKTRTWFQSEMRQFFYRFWKLDAQLVVHLR
jgi:hypothetical protein